MIQTENISMSIGRTQVLDQVSLSVEKGRCLVLLGSSGAGKTSLLRVIAGLERPDSGRVILGGKTVAGPGRSAPPQSRRLSLIFQSLALWPHMTAAQHIAFMAGKDEGRVRALLADVRLEDKADRIPSQLSGGERQRLAIARALASNPDYLLLDEPFSSLDELLKEQLLELTLEKIQARKMAAIYVTHNLEEAQKAADALAVMTGGRISRRWNDETISRVSRNEILDCLRGGGHEK